MIRFSCPGCAATFSVADEKAGKTGKCPKCSTQFVIPAADPAAPPPLPGAGEPPSLPDSAPQDADDGVDIKPCPGCQGRLTVAPGDLGSNVECPYCKTVFRATRSEGTAPSKKSDPEHPDETGRPRRRRDEEDRPSRSRREEEDEDDRPSQRRRRDEGEDDDDRPRRKRRGRGRRGSYEPHRGALILIFGILGWAVCLIFGILAWMWGSEDLRKMDEGLMDPDGRGMTQAGRILGMISCILAVIGIVLGCVIFGFAGMKGR